jgi:hypothetical protein
MKASIVALSLAIVATPAAAQDRSYVQAVGGLSFQASAAGLFGGEGGFHITRDLILFGQAGRMLDVLPRSVQNDLDDAASVLEGFLGRPVRFDAKVAASYVGGGIKYVLPVGARIRPYISGSIDAVRYRGSLRERELGDVLDQAVGLGVVDQDDVKGTEIGYEVGGGVLMSRGRARVDVGYRLMNVKGVNISRVIGGAGIGF